MASSLIAKPSISGNMRQSPQYRSMGFGNTSRILLLGHSDGLSINDPYQVNDVQEAINDLQADSTSPLVRGLLEVYNAGARDVWIMAVAPMDEYVADVDLRLDSTQDLITIDGGAPGSYDQMDIPFDIDGGFPYTITVDALNFYQKYYERLEESYALLTSYDFAEIVVPLEVSFGHAGGVDFAGQLVRFCEKSHASTGMAVLGVLGTRRPSTVSMVDSINEMVSLAGTIPASTGNKYVTIAVGEGAVSMPQMSFTHKTSISAQVAANMATITLDRGIAYSKLTNIINLDGFDYTEAQLNSLVNAKLNPAVRTQKSKRGAPFQTVVLSDNTLASDGSDFWSLSQMRVVAKCSNTIRAMGYGWIGTTDFSGFKQAVFDYLSNLVKSNIIKNFQLSIDKDRSDPGKVNVNVAITPFYGIRQIYFTVEVGPGV